MRAILAAAFGLVMMAASAFAQAPPPPRVTLTTSMGAITIELDPERAPKTVENFLRYVESGHYQGAAIYRVEPGHVIQLGDYDAKLRLRAPKFAPIPLETETSAPHARGAVAMARGGPDTGQSTFFFDLGDNAHLDAKPGAAVNTSGYTVFGHVVAGMDVLDAMAGVELSPTGGPFPGAKPKDAIVVEGVSVE